MARDPASKSIVEFYDGQSILLTGATGFLGTVFIEKVLRSCPDVREIFLLMRPKKGLSINGRLEKIFNLPLYEKLRKELPSNIEKLVPISGDASEKGLGLSPEDKQILVERVTIVIHAAASVKFNNSLKYAIFTNTRATRDICVLAQNMKNLIALVYVGTAFAHINNPVIEEKVYPPIADWQKMIEVAESLDEHTLNIFTAKYLDYMPNTYVFSKNLAESIIQEYSSSLPCAIVRPSMVLSTLKEPIPGWINNIYGPLGLFIGGGKGIIRVVNVKKEVNGNIVPVDNVVKAIIVVSWKLGLTTLMQLQKNVYVAGCALGYFLCNEWKFSDINSLALRSSIPPDNRDMFSFEFSDFDFKEYAKNGIIGCKKFLLFEDMNRLDAAKTHRRRVYLFVTIIETIFAIVMLWIMYKWIYLSTS